MKRKVLILGGTDFIGARLAGLLLQDNELSPVLAGEPSEALPAGVELIVCDVHDQSALAKLLTTINDGGQVVNCVAGGAEYMLRSAHALFAAAKQVGSPPILQVSTLAAYGSAQGVMTEDSSLLGDVDAYSAARAEIDQMAAAYGSICVRPGIIYGPGSLRWSGEVGRLLQAHRLGDLGELGDGICNLLYIDDLLQVIRELLLKPGLAQGALNVCGVERLTWNEYFLGYARVLGAVPIHRLTARRLRVETKVFAPPLKVLQLLVGKRMAQRLRLPELISPSLLRVCAQEIVMDCSKVRQTLAINWTPAAEGLQRAAAWYRSSV